MADESHYSSVTDTATAVNKRKYDDQTPPPPPVARRPTGFSSPNATQAPPSYNSVPPPVDQIQLAKQKVQEIAARLLSGAPPPADGGGGEVKRARVDNNGASGFDSYDNNKGFSSVPHNDYKSQSNSAASAIPVSYGSSYMGSSSKKIEIPNGRVGVIIGKGGETIKYLQIQSGAKIQVTRDMDSDPSSTTRIVELMGNPEQIAKAEQLINEVLSEADAGGSGTVSRRFTGQGGSEHLVLKIPNNKVGLVIGKGGDSIKNMQARTGARIQVIPLHLPPGDVSSERNVHIEGTSEQIELAKQLVNEAISEDRARNTSMAGGYPQQGYQARPPSWGQHGAPQMQQPGYGYMQPGAYPGQSQQYNMSQPSYGGYPPSQSTWDQSNASANQQTSQGYDYYSQQQASSQQQPTTGGPVAPADNSGYNYSQPQASGYNQNVQGYGQDGYGGYSQSGYGQAPTYDQQQGYTSAPGYGSVANATQEGHTPSYGAQGDSTQAPSQPGYAAGQPSPNPASYPTQGTQPGYAVPPTSQSGYGSQPGYASNYGPPQAQKPPTTPPVYGQTQQSPSTHGAYGQPASGYPHSQTPSSGYAQPDSGAQRAPSSGYSTTGSQGGYGAPYGSTPAGQSGYGQGMPPYSASYGGAYSQPAAVYPSDGNPPAAQPTQQSGVAKTSPQS
ncbi:uncharacterized protein LOC126670442 [Mercurialis annua]|uniref:uncharacterized protein LOC126670442 n=1 Tax=Mercurialis annua TaxID=3986 RepID=UPI00215F0377|nr:uncharacterized protein LOC126670442 [Mercurialis annua]